MKYTKLPIGRDVPRIVNAVVEVPWGETNKYEYDEELEVFRLDRPLYASVYYPCEYGFIPSTLSEDGDTLDVLILANRSSFPGCFLEVRPIGVLDMIDQGVLDRKILSAAAHNPSYREIQDYKDVFPHLLSEIEHFFIVYKQLEKKHTEVAGWRGAEAARTAILECHERFKHG